MLTLGMTPGEYVVLGDNIKVYVVKNDGALKIAIDAPREVRILRGDVYERMQQNGELPPDKAGNAPRLKPETQRLHTPKMTSAAK